MEAKARGISSSFFLLLDFLNFCSNVHDRILSNKKYEEGYKFEKYLSSLKNFLNRNDKCKQEKMNFFISHCIIYKDVLLVYKNLFLNKENTFHCLEKIIKDK